MHQIIINEVPLKVEAEAVFVNRIADKRQAITIRVGTRYVNIDVFASDDVTVIPPAEHGMEPAPTSAIGPDPRPGLQVPDGPAPAPPIGQPLVEHPAQDSMVAPERLPEVKVA